MTVPTFIGLVAFFIVGGKVWIAIDRSRRSRSAYNAARASVPVLRKDFGRQLFGAVRMVFVAAALFGGSAVVLYQIGSN